MTALPCPCGANTTYDRCCGPFHAGAFAAVDGQLQPVPPDLRDEVFQQVAATDQRNRCPGGGEHRSKDGSRPWKPTADFNCDPSQTLPGG